MILDWIGAIIVIIAFVKLFQNTDGFWWGVYTIGCFCYVIVNIKAGLYGQALVMLLTGFIGIATTHYYYS